MTAGADLASPRHERTPTTCRLQVRTQGGGQGGHQRVVRFVLVLVLVLVLELELVLLWH
jgi:hypothetical protein